MKIDVEVHSVKMLRETLCVAQTCIRMAPSTQSDWQRHIVLLQQLIKECDRHRPLGPDGKHGNRHTKTCGCDDIDPDQVLYRPGLVGPHSRACGFRTHPHGSECATNCPTCNGDKSWLIKNQK